MPIPHFDLGGSGAPLHFLHANGYPPACYKPLLELSQKKYHVFGMMLRPLWPDTKPRDIIDWHPLSKDLLDFLSDQAREPVIAVGHSIGGIVTLRSAIQDPGRFRALILLDPVLFIPPILVMWNLARLIGIGYRVHPKIPGSMSRRDRFDDLDTVFRGYRNRKVFKYLSDENLRIYIQGIARPRPREGYELAYSPEWETHIYFTGLRDFDLWRKLPKSNVPTLIIRGAETDTFLESAARLVQKKQPKTKIVSVEKSTHILPLEKPQEVFNIMQSFLEESK
jgi:pimeloyl-ACP methyl ester carboxylesterase